MVDYDETMKKHATKMTNFEFLLEIFLLIQGGQGAIREGPELIPEMKNIKLVGSTNLEWVEVIFFGLIM